jgi:uncharacterized integral membrane protein
MWNHSIQLLPIYDMILIHLLAAVGLTPSGSSTVHIYTQPIHRTTQLTTRTAQQRNNTINNLIGKNAGRAPSLRVMPWHLPYN